MKMLKLKAFAFTYSNLAQIMEFVFDRMEKFWEKDDWLVADIFSFSGNFPKALMIRVVITRDCVLNGLTHSQTTKI